MNKIYAIKKATHQNWTATGKRIPVTVLSVAGNIVVSNGEQKTTIGFGKVKDSRASKPMMGMLKKNGITYCVRQLHIVDGTTDKKAGDIIVPSDVLAVGDVVKVTGTSKGLGFAGVVKRHGFAGGPKTHGQSDRERAPGSIGNRTTPGRVFRNKRMAGRGGNKTVTVENLQVVAVNNDNGEVWVKGVVPGAINGTVSIRKVGAGTFEGLFTKKNETKKVEEVSAEKQEVVEEKVAEQPKVESKTEETKEVKK